MSTQEQIDEVEKKMKKIIKENAELKEKIIHLLGVKSMNSVDYLLLDSVNIHSSYMLNSGCDY